MTGRLVNNGLKPIVTHSNYNSNWYKLLEVKLAANNVVILPTKIRSTEGKVTRFFALAAHLTDFNGYVKSFCYCKNRRISCRESLSNGISIGRNVGTKLLG